MKRGLIVLLCFLIIYAAKSQLIAGPMLGQIEYRDAKIWVEVASTAKKLQVQYNKKGNAAPSKIVTYNGLLGAEFNPVHLQIGGLDFNTTYQYKIIVDGKTVSSTNEFTTKDLWQWRKPAPDFSFLTGSCAYTNDFVFDRPGKPYGSDSSIFETMAKEKASFMLWLGDNWYTREVDYFSQWGLWYRAQHTRRQPVIQNFLKAMPHYAIWDDHDYGPNDIGKQYVLKETSKKIFDSYWVNPTSGEQGEGIYTSFSFGDVDFFLMDNRWWRSSDRMKDSINGQPNPEKQMFGSKQLQWLKNYLLHSHATFKIIATGSQVLNPLSTKDKLLFFPSEYYELTNFIHANNIEGVLFLTGDRHHSEIIKVERPGTYPLYDITVSSLTAGVVPFVGPEANSRYRLIGIDKHNYGKLSFSGARGERKLTVEYFDTKGTKLGDWSIGENELKSNK
ncbi:MAG: alkaline phosphatase D family protein [Chitinophagaceae bacterium]